MIQRALLLSLIVITTPLLAQQPFQSEIRRLEQFIEAEMQRSGMPGLSVAIMKEDFHWSKGFGWADLENRVPATAQTSYRMASVTKPMTAVAVLKLVEQGKIDLDAEVQKYVPYFPRKSQPVTVRQLLAHLGGISHYRDYMKEGRIREPKSTREAIAIFQDFDLVAEPGSRYLYSTYGYNLLGAVIEGASGLPYGQFMREQVWQPLGMEQTRMDDPRAIIPHRARGYVMEGGTLKNSEYVDISSRFAGGGTRSTVLDMIKFATGLESGRVLKPETVELMWTAQVTRGREYVRYGLGWVVFPASGRFQVAHSGSQQETRTDLTYFPRKRFAYALASNFEGAELAPIARRIQALFLGDSAMVPIYTADKKDQPLVMAAQSVWNHGLAYYDRSARPMTADRREVAAAFRFFDETIRANDDKMLAQGRHPIAGEAFVKMGSFMAQQLAAAGIDLEKYHREGAFSFFRDYAQLNPRADVRLSQTLVERLGEMHTQWQRAWTPEMVELSFAPAQNLVALEQARAQWAGLRVTPDFSGDLVQWGEQAAQRGDLAGAGRAGALLADLYPESARATGFAGVVAVAAGERERGLRLIEKSRRLDPNGYAGNENLRNIAGVLERLGNKPAAEILRQIAR